MSDGKVRLIIYALLPVTWAKTVRFIAVHWDIFTEMAHTPPSLPHQLVKTDDAHGNRQKQLVFARRVISDLFVDVQDGDAFKKMGRMVWKRNRRPSSSTSDDRLLYLRTRNTHVYNMHMRSQTPRSTTTGSVGYRCHSVTTPTPRHSSTKMDTSSSYVGLDMRCHTSPCSSLSNSFGP